jgi:hypothetical protein
MEMLATGAPLTAETFADFAQRLRYHCQGGGVRAHGTADAIFTVEKRVIDYGYAEDYSENIAIVQEGRRWDCPTEFYATLDDAARTQINRLAQKWHDEPFDVLSTEDKFDMIKQAELDCVYVTCWQDHWEVVNSHFTPEAANAWIDRKGHDYPDGLRVCVDAQSYCWEWNAIKQAIIDGTLIFKGVDDDS